MAHVPTRAAALLVALCVVAVSGCTTDSGRDIQELANPTPTTLEPWVEPQFADTRGVDLASVTPGAPAVFPVTIRGGDAALSGTLTGPDGPVARGRVRLERFVGEASASLDVTTDDRGRWKAKGIVGGRYRVRGWRAPDLAMNSSTLLFLGADERRELDLAATRQGGVDVQAALLTATPTIDQPVSVTALVTRHEVDRDGVVQGIPLTGTVVTLSSAVGWDIAQPQVTVDAAGGAGWSLICTTLGPGPLVVSAGDRSTTLSAPTCRRPVPPTTTTTTPPVAFPVADFPVGRRFTPPFAGPLPAGTYTVQDDAASCSLVYEEWVDTAWSSDRVTVTGTDPVVLDTFARNLTTLGSAPACTYERTA